MAQVIVPEKVVRRRKVKEIADLLRSDLYERTGGSESAIWTSPGNWKVSYTYDQEEEGYQPIAIHIFGPDGREYAHTNDGDVYWLEETLP